MRFKTFLWVPFIALSAFGQRVNVQVTPYTQDLLTSPSAATARSKLGVGTGEGSVSSVAIQFPGVIFSNTVPGSPITSSGTLQPALIPQAANTMLRGPTSGASATPTFGNIVSADIPAGVFLTNAVSSATGSSNAMTIIGTNGSVVAIFDKDGGLNVGANVAVGAGNGKFSGDVTRNGTNLQTTLSSLQSQISGATLNMRVTNLVAVSTGSGSNSIAIVDSLNNIKTRFDSGGDLFIGAVNLNRTNLQTTLTSLQNQISAASGTVTTSSTLTANTIPMATSATALADSPIVKLSSTNIGVQTITLGAGDLAGATYPLIPFGNSYPVVYIVSTNNFNAAITTWSKNNAGASIRHLTSGGTPSNPTNDWGGTGIASYQTFGWVGGSVNDWRLFAAIEYGDSNGGNPTSENDVQGRIQFGVAEKGFSDLSQHKGMVVGWDRVVLLNQLPFAMYHVGFSTMGGSQSPEDYERAEGVWTGTNGTSLFSWGPAAGGTGTLRAMSLTGSSVSIAPLTANGLVHTSGGTGLLNAAPATETDLSFSDVTTADASTTRHGLLPKLDGNSAHYLSGTGGWTTPGGGGGGGTPGGNTGSIQYYDAGNFSGDAFFIYNKTAHSASVTSIDNPGASTMAIVGGGAMTTNFPALAVSQGWNASGTNFQGVTIGITNTASASTSTPLRIQVNNVTIWSSDVSGKVTQAGPLELPAGTVNAPSIYMNTHSGTGFYEPNSNLWGFTQAGVNLFRFEGNSGIEFRSDTGIGWAPNTSYSGGADVQLFRTGTATLGLTGSWGQSGKTTKYNNVSTVSGGVPAEYATIDSTGLTANVGATTLYSVPASGGGMYRVSAYLVTTTAASASSTMPNAQVVYTDSDSNTSVTLDVSPILGAAGLGQSGTLAANTVGTVFSGSVVIYVKASTTIQYQTVNYASTLSGMTYALRMKLETL